MSLDIWNKVREVPKEAKKTIRGGRLKGFTDINPMWRLKVLTEMFGPCGVGWKYVVTNKEVLSGNDGQQSAFVDINLFVKHDQTWSEAIPGTGGSMFVAKESGGLYMSDECFKMALTDALGVACKALGIGADVYWEGDSSKYSQPEDEKPKDRPKTKKSQDPARAEVEALVAQLKFKGKWDDNKRDAAHKAAIAKNLKAGTEVYYKFIADLFKGDLQNA